MLQYLESLSSQESQFYCHFLQVLQICIQYHYIDERQMQSKKYVQNPQIPVFNIRKVHKKTAGIGKNLGEAPYYTPQIEHEKITDFQNFSSIFQQNSEHHDARKQKEKILDQTVNQAIINSKLYLDLKKTFMENKKKNSQQKKALQLQIEKQKNQKKELVNEQEKLQSEKKKYIQAINSMKQKLEAIRETNDKYREALQQHGIRIGQNGEQTQYISNLIMSMRFHAEYQHDIDPDQMTYEELLQLEQKIGSVSRGLPIQVIAAILPKIQVTQEHIVGKQDQRCMVCISNFELGQLKTILTNCKHQFHYQCLESWLGKEKICPLCKQQILFGLEGKNPNQNFNQQ